MNSAGRRGLTLVESTLAIVLVGVIVSAFWSGLRLASRTASLVLRETQAVNLARGLFARVQAAGFTRAKDERGDFGKDYAGTTYELGVRPGRIKTLKMIRVVIRWDDRGGRRELALDSALADRRLRRDGP